MREVKVTTGRGGYSAAVSRMSVINHGMYIKLFPSQEIIDKMKAKGWERVGVRYRLDDDDKIVGVVVEKENGTGIKIRYVTDGRYERPHIPVPTKDIGIAVVSEGSQAHGTCEDEVEEDGFLFRIRDGITFAKKD
jgi:hypothetical protein